ncbi:MAG: FAD-binding protein [Fusobacteriaceae bacterium]|nr:FAD-binding protein [Fusobacteriaceae bacterium]
MNEQTTKIETEVLVIGGGCAGLRAAIAAADAGARTLLAAKGPVGKTGASTHPVAEMAGYNAGDPVIPGDVAGHYEDMMKAGRGMADPILARILAERAPGTIRDLKSWGVKFEREGERDYRFRSCFASAPRTHVVRGHGETMVAAMAAQIALRPEITVFPGLTIVSLIVTEGRCHGAWAIDAKGERIKITAAAVILATGGASRAFAGNLNPADVSGDGYALAYAAGAELINMEFMQAGIGFSRPVVNIFNAYIWAAHPKLSNGSGLPFLEKHLPAGLTARAVMDEHRRHFPFSSGDPSKYLEIAMIKEIRGGGGTARGGIQADLRHLTDAYVNGVPDDCGLHHMWPLARDYMKGRNVDLLKMPVEIAVFAHAVNGGVRIDESARSTIPGLYAAGETAGGPHGADRLGGNMFVTCQVFGALAGESAAIFAKNEKKLPEGGDRLDEETEALLRRELDAAALIGDLQKSNQDNLLVCRSEARLNAVLQKTEALKKHLGAAPVTDQIHPENFRLSSLIGATERMAEAALARRESRGAHYREDFPETDPACGKPIVLKKGNKE